MGLVDRAFLLSHPEFHEKNLKFVIRTLLDNDYPLNFIFKVMTNRIKSLVNNKTFKQNRTTEDINETETTKWFTIPYVGNFSEKFRRVIVGTRIKLAYHSLNKLNKFIKVQKDPLPKLQKKNVVYKICCNDCDASYVGQTGRMLKTRVAEHRNSIRRNALSVSVIADHMMQHGHDMDWNNVQILDVERYYHKRLVSEMLHIKRQRNGLNLQTDTDCLDRGYSQIFNYL